MALIGMRDVSWGLGGTPLLDKVSLQIEKGERICLLGRNGVGKSSLIKLLNGDFLPDSGEIMFQQGATTAILEQEVPSHTKGSLFDVVALGLGDIGRVLIRYRSLAGDQSLHENPERFAGYEALQHQLDASNGWALAPRIEDLLARTGLDPKLDFDTLSAGMKRRALLCRAMIRQPDLLLLDEPTNHLDIDTIVWMEEYIAKNIQTMLFVSHDRAFAKRIANRILELDRGRLLSYACDYSTYLIRREADAQSEENQNRRFDKKLSAEETWIRQGVKARRTRNEGRVQALKKMREAYRARRSEIGRVNMKVQEAERSGKLVIEAKGINYSYAGVPYIKNFSTVIMRGDKIGLIGPNGSGKTTLLKILLQEISPESGSVRHGTQLQVAYFDQLRAQLDENKTVVQNIGEGNDFIEVNGQKRHVISYLQDFLFPPDRSRTPVHILSGGEKNRLLLAKLFVKPANVLVMDEPTNDLDAETLELLEDLLLDYSGTLLLVSHDRIFLNNVVTSTLAFEGKGLVCEYPGGYDDWLLQRPAKEPAPRPEAKTQKTHTARLKPDKPRKLGFKEQRDLKALPDTIDELENEQKQLLAAMSDPSFYKKDKDEIASITERLKVIEVEIATAYRRWEELDTIAEAWD
ncbi:ATP-binding cassette domain-containing protein [Desulfobacterium sp. N47]|uniref:ATP-binding protein Uup n=1 Tax=uncultured Desulfobacterium sp. TaxID=201089 RepID=E1YI73_9BACT|nr:ABC transporter ATP-binding protein uup-1 [uncultured Desulfobacterium sp.]